MSQESHNLPGNQPTYNTPRDIFDDIYGRPQLQAEQEVDPISAKLGAIVDNLEKARKLRLDSTLLISRREINRRRFPIDLARLLFGGVVGSHSLESLTPEILRNDESKKVGAHIFGALGPNETLREFFYDSSRPMDGTKNLISSWFFHHEVVDPVDRKKKERTLHYEHGRPEGVLRISSNPGMPNAIISGQELDDFVTATEMYHDGVMKLYPEYSSNLNNTVQLSHSSVQQDNLYQLRSDEDQSDRLAA